LTGAGAPLAIHGYDPVAYFSESVAMLGSAKHMLKLDGAAYRFVREPGEGHPGERQESRRELGSDPGQLRNRPVIEQAERR
jgi:hypothetical protein